MSKPLSLLFPYTSEASNIAIFKNKIAETKAKLAIIQKEIRTHVEPIRSFQSDEAKEEWENEKNGSWELYSKYSQLEEIIYQSIIDAKNNPSHTFSLLLKKERELEDKIEKLIKELNLLIISTNNRILDEICEKRFSKFEELENELENHFGNEDESSKQGSYSNFQILIHHLIKPENPGIEVHGKYYRISIQYSNNEYSLEKFTPIDGKNYYVQYG